MVVRLLWLSGRVLAAQARGAMGLTPGDCRPFCFPLFTPYNIYFQCEARLSEHKSPSSSVVTLYTLLGGPGPIVTAEMTKL